MEAGVYMMGGWVRICPLPLSLSMHHPVDEEIGGPHPSAETCLVGLPSRGWCQADAPSTGTRTETRLRDNHSTPRKRRT